MKTSHLVAGAGVLAGFLIAVLLWRQGEMADDIAALRARLDALAKAGLPAVASAPSGAEAMPENEAPRTIAEGELASAEERIADLERVANGQADAIEELLNKLNGMGLNDVLIVSDAVDQNLYLAARNLPHVDVRDVQGSDPVSLIAYEKVLITVSAVKKFEELLG